MKRTRRAARMMLVLILTVMMVSIGSISSIGGISSYPAVYADGESSVEFVKSVVKAINSRTETPDMFYAGSAYQFNLNSTPLSHTYFALLDFKASPVEGYPALVDYSCRIPGVITASYCTAYDVCFYRLPKYSKWVNVEGRLKVLELEDGRHMIDISGCDNAFAAYATFRYVNQYYFGLRGVDVSQGYSSGSRAGAVAVLASLGSDSYAKMAGYATTQEYIDAVVLPEMQTVVDNQDKWSSVRNDTGFMQTNLLLKICLGIMAVPLLYVIWRVTTAGPKRRKLALAKGNTDWGRFEAISKLNYKKYRNELADIALTDSHTTARDAALKKLKYPEDRDVIRKIAAADDEYMINEAAIKRLSYPEDKDIFIDVLKNNKNGMYTALEKLHYPEDREAFITAARKSDSSDLRYKALDKLTTPSVREEGEALEYIVRNDDYYRCRIKALERLYCPEFRDTIRYAAGDKDVSVALTAVRKLSPEEDKDIIVKAAQSEHKLLRLEGMKQLRYKDAREILLKAAENDPDNDVRLEALGKLSPVIDYQVINRIYANDTYYKVREQALSMLRYEHAHDLIADAALKEEKAENRRIAIDKLKYPQDKDTLASIARYDKDEWNRTIASEKLPFLDNAEAVIKDGLERGKFDDLSDESIRICERAAIVLAFAPENRKKVKQFLCKNIERGLKEGDKGRHTTLAGWSAAALGRVLALSFKPSDIEANYKKLEPAFEKYNEFIQQAQALYSEFNECRDDFSAYKANRSALYGEDGIFKFTTRDARLRQISGEIDAVHSELAPGPGNYMIDNGDEPMAYLVHVLRDNQSRIPRFIKQGVIMGLVDWLAANRSEPQAADLLKTVLEVRKAMITTDDKLSFFEVRVPERCTRVDYERILADVLHCANPSVKYADMTELMDVAEKEVPGCMDMLTACPLRIIDPANQADLGFYEFEPFISRAWYLYEPPEGIGKVKSRYHEVDDRTRPLSSGLHLRLFTDPYSVIPTLFHEYQHFTGDSNEASVFLKTQMFSIDFYKRYSGAKPTRDVVFATLADLLGMPPQENKRGDLNDLIRKYYGEQVSLEEAKKRATGQLNLMNFNINLHNKNEKWCPEVKYPLFNEQEDKKNMTIIRDSIIKFSTAPKSVTEQEYREITNPA